MIYRTSYSQSPRGLILTVVVAATLADVCNPVQADEKTDELTSLTVAQAKDIVAQHKGTLSFRNLPEVDLDVARVLSQYKGEVRLNGLKRLTPEVALVLSDQPKGANLCLNALTTLSAEAAKALATRPGGMLSLNALKEVSPQLARELSNVRAKLTLNGVTTLSVESARELARHRSKLTLTGLPEISDEAGEALSVHRGTFLLNGLTRLTSPVLVQSLLGKSDGFVGFKKVETMTDEVAAIFAVYEGRKPMALDGLNELPSANAAALRANKKIVLPANLRKPGITNSLGMRLAYIPAGRFGMGSPRDELGRERQEKRHEVELTKEFYLGVHEVTVAQFREFIRDSNYQTDGEKDGKGGWGVNDAGSLELNGKYTWKSPGFKQTDDHPVVLVSWNDAQAFCRWLSKKENKQYRLPTEAQWEYACRAGTKTAYSYGDDAQGLTMFGNTGNGTSAKPKDGHRFTASVGQFKVNQFGLFDMHGNVWEWCEDWYVPNSYGTEGRVDPTGPESGKARVHRGGGWSSAANRCRSAARIGRHPSSYRGSYLGFRIALISAR